ncbi:HAD-IA family hydrolase [Ostreiculturibacter nitratireducens]|uniref:HAD-IA family hydrolase n=1 Tax=Ostreiculturibacter nitratireducens TaxID=3075226 RepID=UPI0031B56D90
MSDLAALVFDVDGTLAETEEAHRRAFNETFPEYGLNWHWSAEDYVRLLKTTGGKERIRAFGAEIGGLPEGLDIAAMHADKTRRYGEIVASGGLELRAGVADLVKIARAAGLRVAVATTTNRPNVDALCRACWGEPAEAVFHVVAAGDEVARKKPAPDVYALALDRLGVSPDRAIAFEDSRNGVLSARDAGLRVVVTPSTYTAHDDFAGADWVIPSLRRQDLPEPLARRIF